MNRCPRHKYSTGDSKIPTITMRSTSLMIIFSKKLWNFGILLLILSASDFLQMTAEGNFLDGVISAANTVSTTLDNVEEQVENTVDNTVDEVQNTVAQVENILKNLTELPVADTEVVFKYFNKDYPDGVAFNIQEFNESKLTGWRQDVALKVITHGWKDSDQSDSVCFIKDAYLQKYDYNLISVDWSGPASDEAYVIAASKTKGVGLIIARLIIALVNGSLVTWDYIHCIGHGLGGHVMAVVGEETNKQIMRLTGLDPSTLIFGEISLPDVRVLDLGDAVFVDVIFTAGGELGGSDLISFGDIDFYPNGGRHPQPGCPNLEIKCSNGRAYEFFAESITKPNAFVGYECGSWLAYEAGECNNNAFAVMGDQTPSTAQGQFYLATNDAPPFGKGNAA